MPMWQIASDSARGPFLTLAEELPPVLRMMILAWQGNEDDWQTCFEFVVAHPIEGKVLLTLFSRGRTPGGYRILGRIAAKSDIPYELRRFACGLFNGRESVPLHELGILAGIVLDDEIEHLGDEGYLLRWMAATGLRGTQTRSILNAFTERLGDPSSVLLPGGQWSVGMVLGASDDVETMGKMAQLIQDGNLPMESRRTAAGSIDPDIDPAVTSILTNLALSPESSDDDRRLAIESLYHATSPSVSIRALQTLVDRTIDESARIAASSDSIYAQLTPTPRRTCANYPGFLRTIGSQAGRDPSRRERSQFGVGRGATGTSRKKGLPYPAPSQLLCRA